MSGRYLLDTNAVIALLGGNLPLANLLAEADWIGISIIVELELLAFPGLSEADRLLFKQFKSLVDVLSLSAHDSALLNNIIAICQKFKVNLPDAIIAASALQDNTTLITNDNGSQRIEHL